MDFELKALTEPGKRMVDLAEEHSANFAATASEHDREGTFRIEKVTFEYIFGEIRVLLQLSQTL